jgi:ATP-binding cassette subfamily F protein 3
VLALIAGERPALLVLDEPTNHLDLDMRDALAMALQDFEGALIIVAHDRSMLARTVDEYWLVENGTVSRLQTDLAGYTDMHNPAGPTAVSGSAGGKDRSAASGSQSADRKAQRRAAAERRAEERPLQDSIRKLEKSMEKLNDELKAVEAKLADTDTYQSLPPDELDELLKSAAKLRSRRDDAETSWLEQSERLEALRATAAR